MIMHLFEDCAKTARIAYLFCEFDNDASTNATTILRSIARQLLHGETMTDAIKDELIDLLRPGQLSIQSLAKLLHYAAAQPGVQFILIDALDECTDEDRKAVLKILGDLITNAKCNVKIAVSGRAEYNEYSLGLCDNQYMIDTSSPEARSDLDIFIDRLISIKVAEGELVVNDPALLTEICEALRERADGM